MLLLDCGIRSLLLYFVDASFFELSVRCDQKFFRPLSVWRAQIDVYRFLPVMIHIYSLPHFHIDKELYTVMIFYCITLQFLTK